MSLLAYKAAIDEGADGFECDVRLTKDNQLILWHDPDLQRLAGSKARVADTTFNEIKRAHPGALTLEELLILAKDSKKELAIETKHPVPTANAVEKEVMKLLAQEKPAAQIYIMSFSWLAIEKIRMINPEQKTVALLHDNYSKLMRRFTSASAIGPSISSFRSFTKSASLKIDPRQLFVWTVDDAKDVRFCADNGVDVVITNNPSNARSALGYH
jgi:glycerophosphoryl diester phosphodiesterase